MQHLAERGAPLATVPQVTVDELARSVTAQDAFVLDVAAPNEWQVGHIPSARHIPLGYLAERLAELPDRPVVVQCQAGARSAIAASVLQRTQGRTNVRNLAGGFASWQGAGLPVAVPTAP